MNEYYLQILTQFRNKVLNAAGVRRDFYRLIQDKDIDKAVSMMQDRSDEVDEAILEYNPQTHKVMSRPDKPRKKMEPYKVEKLPRTRQRYINEVELFFLLGSPIEWRKDSGDDEAFTLFTDFIADYHLNGKIRQLKRLAGSETEASLVFRLFREDNGQMGLNVFIAARSLGYKLRTLFDQYGNLVSLAYGYIARESNREVQHWDILTAENTFECAKGPVGWEVSMYPNPTGKINALYARQAKSWDGVESRIDREEYLVSKTADTNNYFADPIAAATADVVQMMTKNNQKERIGQLIQLTGKDSDFRYINPPQNSETRRDELGILQESILFDSLTPDLSFDKMRGLGTLSGAAVKNAMVLGYIKRDKNKELWEDYIERLRNIIIALLIEIHPEKKKSLEGLRVSFSFGEPFASDKRSEWASIAQLYTSGVLSLEEAVTQLTIAKAPAEEIEKIRNGMVFNARTENQS